MISFVLKFSIAFVLSYVLLSVPFGNRPLFYHLTKITGPIGGDIHKSISKSVKRSVSKTKDLGTQLFEGSTPPKIFDDRVKRKQSAILRKRRERIKKSNHIQEDLRHSEKASLDKLINKK
jgi:hypothetical protein